ncbi:hypothetical protein COOONC_02231 [Cooperia oncophora]
MGPTLRENPDSIATGTVNICVLSASLHSAIAAIIFGPLTLLCTIIIAVKLFNAKLQRLCPAEKTMFVFEVFLALTTLMYATTQALLYSSKYLFKDAGMQNAVLFFRNFIIDVFILPNAWTLPLLCTTVRRFYKRTLLRMTRRDSRTQTTRFSKG